LKGAPKLRGFESDTVSHFDKLITEEDDAASRGGGRERVNCFKNINCQPQAQEQHASYVTCREREREREIGRK